jgi:hypothetical protein
MSTKLSKVLKKVNHMTWAVYSAMPIQGKVDGLPEVSATNN